MTLRLTCSVAVPSCAFVPATVLSRFCTSYRVRANLAAHAWGFGSGYCAVRDEFLDSYFRRAQPEEVMAIIKAREPARILIAIGDKKENRWHLELKQRWVEQYNFYVNDTRWGRMFVRVCPYFPFSARVCLNQHYWLANLSFAKIRSALNRLTGRGMGNNRQMPVLLLLVFRFVRLLLSGHQAVAKALSNGRSRTCRASVVAATEGRPGGRCFCTSTEPSRSLSDQPTTTLRAGTFGEQGHQRMPTTISSQSRCLLFH